MEQGRRDPRYEVTVDASIRNDAVNSSPVKVTNLSASGCRFSSIRRVENGSLIVLSIGRAAVEAIVCWRFGGAHGARFRDPLQPAALDHIRLFLSEEPAFVAEREPQAA